MKNEIQLMVSRALPELSATSITYNAARNAFISAGYVSAAGNNYYKVMRLSKRLAIFYNIGEGYARTFLNGITLFAWNGKSLQVIAQRFWGGANWQSFSEAFAMNECVKMLKDFLVGQAKLQGGNISENELLSYSRAMVEEAVNQKLIA